MLDFLHKGNVYALYAQVALLDAEDKDSYPQWETGTEEAILGPKGVVVATAPDTEVEVIVCKGDSKPDGLLRVSGEIQVGSKGLLVGNVVSGDLIQLAWPAGEVLVGVYTNGPSEEVTQVIFFLKN